MNFNVFFIAMNMTCKWELPPSNATTVIRLLDQGGVICLTDDALFHGGLILVKWHQRFSSQFTLRTYAAQWSEQQKPAKNEILKIREIDKVKIL